ncbi:MAG: efflux transporter outer membrane subunit [Planctomycetota bacterium]|nr:efflux transporter outer membrane subunit [Planctomycetota bacterium]
MNSYERTPGGGITWLPWVGTLALTLASCTAPGATGGMAELATEHLTGEAFAEAPAPLEFTPSHDWWKRFEDPLLNSWIEVALLQNQSLESAAQSVLEAEAIFRGSHGQRGIQLDAGLSASRGFITPTADSDRSYSTLLRPSLQISWQTDLFGRLRNLERASLASLLAADNDRIALAHSLIASLVRSRVSLSVLNRRLDLANRVVKSREETLGIVEGRYKRGVSGTSAVDVHQAKENLAAAQSNLPNLELATRQASLNIQVLLGQKPGANLEYNIIAGLPNVEAPPTGVPMGLLDRRPDLRAAQFRAHATAAQVDVALADFYPDLRLTATGGWDAKDLDELFDVERLFGTLLGDLSVRLFGSGQLDANEDAARARLAIASANYQTLVINAVREVEDALASERLIREQLAFVQTQVNEAQTAESLARDRYSRGVGSLLVVLDTERRRANAEDLSLLLQQLVWNARVDLHLALGGDWLENGRENEIPADDANQSTEP